MPSKSKAQSRFMKGVAHGMQPKGGGGPSKQQAREFVKADQKQGTSNLPPRKGGGQGVSAGDIAGAALNRTKLPY